MHRGVGLLLILTIAVLLAGTVMAMAVGVGWLGTKLFPFSLFESTALFLGSALLLGGAIATAMLLGPLRKLATLQQARSVPDEKDGHPAASPSAGIRRRRRIMVVDKRAAGRDRLCPCGSGKRFGDCCAN